MYLAQAASAPVAYVIGLLIGLAALAGVAMLVARVAQQWRLLRMPAGETAQVMAMHAVVRRQLQYEAALVIATAGYIGVFTLHRQGLFAMPRYVLPLFVLLPALVARLDRLAQWLAACWSWQAIVTPTKSVALAALVVPMLAWNLAACIALRPVQTAARDHGVWIMGRDQPLLALLRAHGVRTVRSNDYWLGPRLTFESNERVIVIMVHPDGTPGFNRYAPYLRQGMADPRPAYLELQGSDEAVQLDARAAARKLAGYTRYIAGGCVIYIPTESS